MKLFRVLTAACVLGMSACAATGETQTLMLENESGRSGIAGVRLGEPREAVIAALESQFSVSPECNVRKVGIKDSRKSFLHETCKFATEGPVIGGASVTLLTCHFIENTLMMIDIKANSAETSAALLQSEIDMHFGRGSEEESAANTRLTVWDNQRDEALLHVSNDGLVQLQLIDTNIVNRAPSLAAVTLR